ncbi:MAG TPA: GTP-binding protein, partial [Candidatus Tumulicola sp.]
MANVDRLRNIAIVGPHHGGKTTLVEAILSKTGAVGRRGSVSDGTTVTDHEPEDVAHVQSTSVGFAHFSSDGIDVTIADCPGFVDFFAETKAVLRGVDAAIVVIEADPQRVVQCKATVDFLETLRLPHIFVVNKMDRPGADFGATLAALQDAYGRHVVAEQLPIGNAEQFEGYIDLAERKAWKF